MGATSSTLASPPTPTSPTLKHGRHTSFSQIYPDFQQHLNALQSNGFAKAISRRKSSRASGSANSIHSNSSSGSDHHHSSNNAAATSSGASNTSTVLSSHREEGENGGGGRIASEFRFIHGRKYHNHSSSRYVLPCDSEEIDRLHLQHYVLKLALQKNLHVPLPSTGCVLDVGCGGATWTMDMATDMPNATFYGIDIAPIYPTAIHPRNCHFSKQDITERTNFDADMFDVVFQRNLSFGLTPAQWEASIQESLRIIKPGGYFESAESDCLIHAAGPQTARVMQVLRHMLRSGGVDPDIIHSLPAKLTKQGFEEVTLKQYNIPLGPRGGRMGQLWQQNVFAVLDVCRRRLAKYANLNEQQVGEIVAEMQRETAEDYEPYMTIYVTYARKPLRALIRALVRSKNPVAVRKTFDFSLGDYLFLEPAGKWTGKFAFEDEEDDGRMFGGGGGRSGGRCGAAARGQGPKGGGNTKNGQKALDKSSQKNAPGEAAATAAPSFQVKVDVVADHGTSWLRINAGSVWSLAHEFAGMEDDSDDDDDEEEEDHNQTGQSSPPPPPPPVHVSKETHSDLTILTRSLVLAADQNRIHYHHLPKITMLFAGIQPDESKQLEGMIFKAIETARYSQSLASHQNYRVPMEVVMGSEDGHQRVVGGGGDSGVGGADGSEAESNDATATRPGRAGERRILLDQDRNMTKQLLSALDAGELDALFIKPSTDAAEESTVDAEEIDEYGPYKIPRTLDDMKYFTSTLNLDITTLMALSSWLCHTVQPDPDVFTSPPLRFQAQQEKDGPPILPMLYNILRGRERLVVTQSAATRFLTILNLIGGPEEQWRGRVLMRDIIPDFKTTVEDTETDERIKARWVAMSEWASRFGIFKEGPPKIDVIEDAPMEFRPPEPKPPPRQRNRKKKATVSSSSAVSSGSGGSQSGGSGTSTPTTPETATPFAPTAPPSHRQEYRDNKQGRAEWLKEQEMMELHAKIFMTGYQNQITTLTANLVGYRAVIRTGNVPPRLSVWFHAPRSLAEAKVRQAGALPTAAPANGGQ